jgi:hypothetical protein
MPGGSTAAMHRVRLVDGDDLERDVVLPPYIRPEVLAESPDGALVEARALQLADRLPVPTQRCSPSTQPVTAPMHRHSQ